MHVHTHVGTLHAYWTAKNGQIPKADIIYKPKKVKRKNLRKNVTDHYKFSEAYFAFAPKCICPTYRVMSVCPLTESNLAHSEERKACFNKKEE